MEEKLQHSLYKLELHWIKIIPMVMALLVFTGTLLSYFEIDTTVISYINALLVWLFLYLSSSISLTKSIDNICLYVKSNT